MQINLINNSKQSIGGGWTFLRTFEKYLGRFEHTVADDAPVVFVASATMTHPDTIQAFKNEGKKVVLRVDNIPRNSRNRNSGTSRLKAIADMADLVVYQSKWAKALLEPFLKKDGPVILNGADTEIFNAFGDARPKDGSPQFLYARYSRDETKQWHVAYYDYIELQRKHQEANLWIVGQFSPELVSYNFDFFMGERISYLGVFEDPTDMAEAYRGCDILLIPYYNDACSQTLIEAMNCGVKNMRYSETGGNMEIISAPLFQLSATHMTSRYIDEIKRIL